MTGGAQVLHQALHVLAARTRRDIHGRALARFACKPPCPIGAQPVTRNDELRQRVGEFGDQCHAGGGGKTVALNAADEVAVSAFLDGNIRFVEIPELIEQVVSETPVGKLESIKEVLRVDQAARASARERVARLGRSAVPVAARQN